MKKCGNDIAGRLGIRFAPSADQVVTPCHTAIRSRILGLTRPEKCSFEASKQIHTAAAFRHERATAGASQKPAVRNSHQFPEGKFHADLRMDYSPPRRGGVARQLNRSWRAGREARAR